MIVMEGTDAKDVKGSGELQLPFKTISIHLTTIVMIVMEGTDGKGFNELLGSGEL